MKDFYCYICNNYITHDVFMAHDLAFCCNTHRNTHLRKLNGLENNIIKTKKILLIRIQIFMKQYHHIIMLNTMIKKQEHVVCYMIIYHILNNFIYTIFKSIFCIYFRIYCII